MHFDTPLAVPPAQGAPLTVRIEARPSASGEAGTSPPAARLGGRPVPATPKEAEGGSRPQRLELHPRRGVGAWLFWAGRESQSGKRRKPRRHGSNGAIDVRGSGKYGSEDDRIGVPYLAKGDKGKRRKGLTVERRYTAAGESGFDNVVWERRQSIITNPTAPSSSDGRRGGTQVGRTRHGHHVSKYFRKAGLHGDKAQGEMSVRQVVERIAHTIRVAGEDFGGYFASKKDADAFEAELSFMMTNQYGAFNSPVWFNCGLFHAYGIEGSGGNWAWQPETDAVVETENAYARPQCSACFIQAVNDDLMSIYELVKSEARLFKYGSGTGSNFSSIRGRQEKLSGGGTSSGLMSFLEVLDRAAGATTSGGTTRRAAKMVCLDMDHPNRRFHRGIAEERKARPHRGRLDATSGEPTTRHLQLDTSFE